MKPFVRAGVLAAALLPCAAQAGSFDVELDARAVAVDARRSFLDGGLGKLRFGDGSDVVELGRMRLAWRGTLGEIAHVSIDASTWKRGDTNPIDLTEAFVELRPVPTSAWRSRVRAGAFYPRISLEHRASGWTNPYTISSSALNTWVGEELRAIGLEYALDWRGTQLGQSIDAGVAVSAFGWNDPAGVVVAFRGFALHDRQTPLFGRLRTWVPAGPQERVLFAEIDDRVGYYVDAHARIAGRTELRALHYDNRADPAAFDAQIQDYAWETRFDSVGLRHDADSGFTAIAQWLDGVTWVGPGRHDEWRFDAAFLLASQQLGRHRLAARADVFAMSQVRTIFPGALARDRGEAWTLGWTYEPTERLALSADLMQVDSNYNKRLRLREAPRARERSLQLGVRYRFSVGEGP